MEFHGSKIEKERLNYVFPFIIFVYLIFAVIAKYIHFYTAVDPRVFPLGSRFVAAILICGELLLSMWLISGFYASVARSFCIFTFSFFCCVRLVRIYNGESSCGCFGSLQTSPYLSLLFNIIALLVLTRWRPGSSHFRSQTLIQIGYLARAVLVTTLIFSSLYFQRSISVGDVGEQLGNSDTIVLTASEWVSNPFHLKKFIEGGDIFAEGSWRIILYDPTCKDCKETISTQTNSKKTKRKIALIRVRGDSRLDLSLGDFHSNLDSNYRWFAALPIVVDVDDGIVGRLH